MTTIGRTRFLQTVVLACSLLTGEQVNAGLAEGRAAYNRKDYTTAYRELLPIARRGDVAAQLYLGLMHSRGLGVQKDDRAAFNWYQLAADQGDAGAQHNLANMYRDGRGIARDDFLAALWYRKAAEQGLDSSQYELGRMYSLGLGVDKDALLALEWLRRAAEQGNVLAQAAMGEIYRLGLGVPVDEKAAAGWYRKAAEAGIAMAQFYLGLSYLAGIGVEKDLPEALNWFTRAAQQGDAHAQVWLGQLYANGEGVPRDDQAAAVWYRRAAEQGDADAQGRLGVLLSQGRGVVRSEAEAYFWFLLAAAKGNETAAKNRDIVERRLTAEQKADVQARARVWAPSLSNQDGRSEGGGLPPKATGRPLRTGSGFRVSASSVLTNEHVIRGCSRISIDGRDSVRVVASDERNDLALIDFVSTGAGVASVRVGKLRLGERVTVAGFPLHGLLSGLNVTSGNVSALQGLKGDSRYMQLTAPVQPGNSGGPVLDSRGAVVGVVVSKLDSVKVAERTGDIPQNVNFAISVNTLKSFLESNDVAYRSAGDGPSVSDHAVADRAKAITHLIQCWE